MNQKTLTSTLCILALGLAAFVLGSSNQNQPEAAPVNGTWQCMSHGGQNGDMPFTLELQQDGENVTGSVSSPLGDADISQASFKDGKLEIEIDTEDESYILTATLSNGQLKGEWKHGEQKGGWEGKKGAPPSQSPQSQ